MAVRVVAPGPAIQTPAEVAAACGVEPWDLKRWAAAGKLPSIRTPGGHRRYRQPDVVTFLSERAREQLRGAR